MKKRRNIKKLLHHFNEHLYVNFLAQQHFGQKDFAHTLQMPGRSTEPASGSASAIQNVS